MLSTRRRPLFLWLWNSKLREDSFPALVCSAAVLWNPAAGCSECCVSGPGQLQRVYYRVCKSAGQRNPALHKYGLLRVPRHVADVLCFGVQHSEKVPTPCRNCLLTLSIYKVKTRNLQFLYWWAVGLANIIKTTRHWRYLQTSVPISNMSYMSAPAVPPPPRGFPQLLGLLTGHWTLHQPHIV